MISLIQDRISKPLFGLMLSFICALLFARLDPKLSIILPVLPLILGFLILTFYSPVMAIYAVLISGFLTSLLSRYAPGIPFGLSLDGLLVLGVVAVIFHQQIHSRDINFWNGLTGALFIWLLYSIFQFFNPMAQSKIAWFYANRGLSFYPILIIAVTLYTFRTRDHNKWFLIIWALLSLFGTLWGMKQLFFGVSAVEQRWLAAGAASTHILFGKLRVFSYYSDAAQFGASQAHTAVVFGILALSRVRWKLRMIFGFIALLSFYGMLISGTRGALAIIAFGGFTYLLLTKNFRILLTGMLAALLFFCFLKFTTIGQSNYQINRMRTTLDANDPSLMVRKEREAVLSAYLADKPIGGGIGSAGYWGKRFSPGTFLAEIGTDGHYTRIWMETGIIGLYLYLGMLFFLIIYLGFRIWKIQNQYRMMLIAFFAGFIGLCVASYTNGLMVQNPTGPLLFTSLKIVWLKTRK
jgi:hypothetical protein